MIPGEWSETVFPGVTVAGSRLQANVRAVRVLVGVVFYPDESR
jgi:hypothetical protein